MAGRDADERKRMPLDITLGFLILHVKDYSVFFLLMNGLARRHLGVSS
jgi:hypothetical protein